MLWVDLLQRATSVPLLFLWEARPRGEGELSARSRAKLRPGAGLPQEGPKPCLGADLLQRATSVPLLFLWEARPRGEGELSCPLKSKSFAPGAGLPQKVKSLARGWIFYSGQHPCRFCFCGRRAPAAKASFLPAQEQKLRPGGGAPTEGPKPCLGSDLLQRATSAPLLFLWEARPRGEGELSCPLKSKSFAPRSGLLQKSPATRSPMRILR